MEAIEFRAPWSRSLRKVTALSVTVLLLLVCAGIAAYPRLGAQALVLIVIPLILIVVCAAFAVRGYVLGAKELSVRRLCHVTRIPLGTLRSVAGDDGAMRHSIQLFGNGGLFAFSGWRWSRRLGRYRAFATDPSRAVVLRFADDTVVITPDDPQRFIVRARTELKNREGTRDVRP